MFIFSVQCPLYMQWTKWIAICDTFSQIKFYVLVSFRFLAPFARIIFFGNWTIVFDLPTLTIHRQKCSHNNADTQTIASIKHNITTATLNIEANEAKYIHNSFIRYTRIRRMPTFRTENLLMIYWSFHFMCPVIYDLFMKWKCKCFIVR